MTHRYLFSLLCLFTSSVFSQQVLWTKNAAFTSSKGMFCDKDGNVYNYGSSSMYSNATPYNFSPGLNDTVGSYLAKYSAAGDLVFLKRYNFPFWISDIVYDGNVAFYVCGTFAGQSTIDGKNISSQGNTDGFVAKMNMAGEVIWINGLGGTGTDCANSITFSKNNTGVVVTGGVEASLYMNNNLVQSGTQRSVLLAAFGLSGDLLQHKLIDFLPSKNIGNCGYEINADNNGNFYLLHDREGKTWSNDNTVAPPEGTYLCKLDAALNITWSTFVISGECYYGYTSRRMSQSPAGESYVPSYCSGKYGGTGLIKRMDASTGALTWSCTSNDGSYADTYATSQNMYAVGTEGANGCPCEDNHPGYQVIKKFDNNNQLLGETRISNVKLLNITSNNNGTVYVLGSILSGQALVGSHLITHSGGNSGREYFLIALGDVNCSPLLVNGETVNHRPITACPGNPVVLKAPAGSSSYKWSNGATTYSTLAVKSGRYWVEVQQESGCLASSMPVEIQVSEAPKSPLLAASFEKANAHNELEWFHNSANVSAYKIHRRQDGKTETLALVPATKFRLEYNDGAAVTTQAATYFLTSIDTCGNESEAGPAHTTMNLVFKTEGGVPVLSWNAYTGFDYKKFYIFRGTSPDAMSLIDSLDASELRYVDQDEPAPYYYQVLVQHDFNTRSFSNITEGWSAGTAVISSLSVNGKLDDLRIFPNPSSGVINLQLNAEAEIGNVQIIVRNILGQTVNTKTMFVNGTSLQTGINISDAKAGLYFIEVRYADKSTVVQALVN